ncbi:Subtilisin-like protease [Smittium mucronatum]|uniref:Subtilisin-like protease n=1 Tax=Smittium mucronatum TaxID=133383 RepID=A0A1R0GRQ7_9FUNG|nr:Subtilisin-like protease [Smittium mucronatum]
MLLSYISSFLFTDLFGASKFFSRELPVEKQAPLLSSKSSKVAPDQYIIVFKKDVTPDEDNFMTHFVKLHGYMRKSRYGLVSNKIVHIYREGLVGYSGVFNGEIIDCIRYLPEVDYVEKDQIVRAYNTQNGSPWGLARISHREKLTSNTFDKYIYSPSAGQGVTAYVVDTGIYIQNSDFQGRAVWGKTLVSGQPDSDGNGHGTHVAGTIGSKTYGVAKNSKLVAVKVFDDSGSGYLSDVIAGVQYTVTDFKSKITDAKIKGLVYPKSVGNLSLGSGFSQAMNSAVAAAVGNGITYVVAAGNSADDACKYSPASESSAITVGSTDLNDAMSYFSNYGSCVSIFAPGRSVLSTWIGSTNATNTISGTSMATPHVTGLAAYILSQNSNSMTPIQVKKVILSSGTLNKITGLGSNSTNSIAYNSPPAN